MVWLEIFSFFATAVGIQNCTLHSFIYLFSQYSSSSPYFITTGISLAFSIDTDPLAQFISNQRMAEEHEDGLLLHNTTTFLCTTFYNFFHIKLVFTKKSLNSILFFSEFFILNWVSTLRLQSSGKVRHAGEITQRTEQRRNYKLLIQPPRTSKTNWSVAAMVKFNLLSVCLCR